MTGQWKPGQSGNPNGRPPGSGEVAKMREAISSRLPEIIDSLVGKALEGDVSAARLLVERVIPPLRAQELPVRLSLSDTGSFTNQGREVLRAIANEQIDTGRGAGLITSIAHLARIAEIDELTNRITALEERLQCQV